MYQEVTSSRSSVLRMDSSNDATDTSSNEISWYHAGLTARLYLPKKEQVKLYDVRDPTKFTTE